MSMAFHSLDITHLHILYTVVIVTTWFKIICKVIIGAGLWTEDWIWCCPNGQCTFVQFAIVIANNSNRIVLVDDNAINMCTIFSVHARHYLVFISEIILKRRLIEHLHLFCICMCYFPFNRFWTFRMRLAREIQNRTIQHAVWINWNPYK